MTIGEINTYVSFRGSTNTTDYSAANRLISTNRWYHKIQTMIFESMSGYQHDDLNLTSEPVISKNLVANQGYVDIGVSDEILKIHRIEVSYDGTNYYPADLMQPAESGASLASQTAINNAFQTTRPQYNWVGRKIYLYPVPTSSISGGLKLWVSREADEFTSGDVSTGTKEPGYDEPFHVMIALGMLYDWCSAKGGKSQSLTSLKADVTNELADLEARLRRHYGSKNEHQTMQLDAKYISYE